LQWAEATDRVLSKVGVEIARPIVEAIPDAEERLLFLSAGFLTAIPIHAAPLEGADKRAFERFRGFAYVPSPAILQSAVYDWTVHAPAVCILSDPAMSPTEELTNAPGELCEVAEILTRSGISVTVIAGVGSQSGRDVFEKRGISLPGEVTLLELTRHASGCVITSVASLTYSIRGTAWVAKVPTQASFCLRPMNCLACQMKMSSECLK
jgi:hypothetical protein